MTYTTRHATPTAETYRHLRVACGLSPKSAEAAAVMGEAVWRLGQRLPVIEASSAAGEEARKIPSASEGPGSGASRR